MVSLWIIAISGHHIWSHWFSGDKTWLTCPTHTPSRLLPTRICHYANFVVTGSFGDCHIDNLECHHWQQKAIVNFQSLCINTQIGHKTQIWPPSSSFTVVQPCLLNHFLPVLHTCILDDLVIKGPCYSTTRGWGLSQATLGARWLIE